MISFDMWMELMRAHLQALKITHGLEESFVEAYSEPSMWHGAYSDGISPQDAMEIEFSYVGEE